FIRRRFDKGILIKHGGCKKAVPILCQVSWESRKNQHNTPDSTNFKNRLHLEFCPAFQAKL
ncbi:MAG: hypothetical protein K2N36_06820, partial [Ruminiclostridium sp.]|nr:hypothetical protein [Ruminiclostridium sp.]